MRLFSRAKDGGPHSHVTGYWLVELKALFSVALLRFDDGTREDFHDHAFGAVSWLLRGQLTETLLNGDVRTYRPGLLPIVTSRATFHRVSSAGRSWALTFRGPWTRYWREWSPRTGLFTVLSDGRVVRR